MRFLRGLGQPKQPAKAEEPKPKELKPAPQPGAVPSQPKSAEPPRPAIEAPMSAAALVDGAAAASTRSYATENEIRKLSAVQRVLDAPDAVRAEAIACWSRQAYDRIPVALCHATNLRSRKPACCRSSPENEFRWTLPLCSPS